MEITQDQIDVQTKIINVLEAQRDDLMNKIDLELRRLDLLTTLHNNPELVECLK